MRRFLTGLGALAAALIALALAYAGYVLLYEHRIEDHQALEIVQNAGNALETDREYALLTWNLGFGAYSADYSFFMDGGEHARARSREAVEENVAAMIARVRALHVDLALLQEVDVDSDRSWHVDQRAMLLRAFPDMSACFAVNYDSPYLFYPFRQPIGRSHSGLMTLSAAPIDQAVRRSLPLEEGLARLIDLDRCYSLARLPVANGGTLCLYNLHLSAYTRDGSIASEQLRLLLADMAAEYARGNYALAAGDFNKDLLGDSDAVFGVSGDAHAWAQPFPAELLPDGISLYASANAPTCRNADAPYDPQTAFVLSVDGFLASANIEALSCLTVDEGFVRSDHNPAILRFRLLEAA